MRETPHSQRSRHGPVFGTPVVCHIGFGAP